MGRKLPWLWSDEIDSIEAALDCLVTEVPRMGQVAVVTWTLGWRTVNVGLTRAQIAAARRMGIVRYVRMKLDLEADKAAGRGGPTR